MTLQQIVAKLAGRGPPPTPLTDPLALVLWENVGYLIDDERRARLFADFTQAVGLSPAAIAEADEATLLALARRGGLRPETRGERWREIARIVLGECGGDLEAALRAAAPRKARSLIKRFPMIGDPGADKILLFAGIAVQPALDSNGLRALVRLGVAVERPSYVATYRAAADRLAAEGKPSREWQIDAHMRLRDLGRTLCRRAVPECIACPLAGDCPQTPVAGGF